MVLTSLAYTVGVGPSPNRPAQVYCVVSRVVYLRTQFFHPSQVTGNIFEWLVDQGAIKSHTLCISNSLELIFLSGARTSIGYRL